MTFIVVLRTEFQSRRRHLASKFRRKHRFRNSCWCNITALDTLDDPNRFRHESENSAGLKIKGKDPASNSWLSAVYLDTVANYYSRQKRIRTHQRCKSIKSNPLQDVPYPVGETNQKIVTKSITQNNIIIVAQMGFVLFKFWRYRYGYKYVLC